MKVARRYLLVALAAVLGSYAGFFYARVDNPWAGESIVIMGLSAEGMDEALENSSLLRTEQGLAKHAETNLSPLMAVTKCKIETFQIDSGLHLTEQASVQMDDISPVQLRCLLAASATEFKGIQQPNSFLPPNYPPHYRPLHMYLEENKHEQAR